MLHELDLLRRCEGLALLRGKNKMHVYGKKIYILCWKRWFIVHCSIRKWVGYINVFIYGCVDYIWLCKNIGSAVHIVILAKMLCNVG